MAGVYDITIDKNSFFEISFELKDENGEAYDLQGYTAEFIARETNSVVSDVVFVADTVLLIDGTVQVNVLAATTKGITVREGYYNIVITSSAGQKTRVVEGDIKLTGTLDEH